MDWFYFQFSVFIDVLNLTSYHINFIELSFLVLLNSHNSFEFFIYTENFKTLLVLVNGFSDGTFYRNQVYTKLFPSRYLHWNLLIVNFRSVTYKNWNSHRDFISIHHVYEPTLSIEFTWWYQLSRTQLPGSTKPE